MVFLLALAGFAPVGQAGEWHGGKDTAVVFPPVDAHDFEHNLMRDNAPVATEAVPADSAKAADVASVPVKHAKLTSLFGKLAVDRSATPGLSVRTGSSVTVDDWSQGKRAIKGLAFDVLPGGAMASHQISLYGGTVASGSGYTSGVRWINRFSADDVLGADLAYNAASTDPGTAGAWLARVGGGMNMPSPLGGPDWRFRGGFSAVAGGSASNTDLTGSSGGFVSLSRALAQPGSGLSYGVSARRYGGAFQPWQAAQIPDEQSLTSRVLYHFSSGMAMRLSSKVAADRFDGDDPSWLRQTSIGLVGVTLPWVGPDVSANVEALTRYRSDRAGHVDSRASGFDVKLRRSMGYGWRGRIGVGFMWKRDLLNGDGALHRQFTFAGRHSLHIGRFNGTLGPGIAWRCSSGYDASQELQAGLIMQWADYANIWTLNVAYLHHRDQFEHAVAIQSFRTMLSYRIAVGGNARSQLGGGWFQPALNGF